MSRARRSPHTMLFAAGIALLGLVAACDRPPQAADVLVIRGTVATIDEASQELVVRVIARTPERDAPPTAEETFVCAFDERPEIFVNDQLAPFSAVHVGDNISLVGFRERTRAAAKLPRISIDTAEIERDEPADPNAADLSSMFEAPTIPAEESHRPPSDGPGATAED